jgi:hypothetical protein
MSELRDKLTEDILTAAPWGALRQHTQNLIIVDGISLVDAGEALALDDADRVEAWLESEVLRRPSAEEFEAWEGEEPDFVALIVQPWVLLAIGTE